MDLSDLATGRKSDGDRGRGDVFGEFRDGEDIVGIERKKGGLNFPPKRFEGAANSFEAVPRILHHMDPRIVGEADLMAKERHGISFSGGLGERTLRLCTRGRLIVK